MERESLFRSEIFRQALAFGWYRLLGARNQAGHCSCDPEETRRGFWGRWSGRAARRVLFLVVAFRRCDLFRARLQRGEKHLEDDSRSEDATSHRNRSSDYRAWTRCRGRGFSRWQPPGLHREVPADPNLALPVRCHGWPYQRQRRGDHFTRKDVCGPSLLTGRYEGCLCCSPGRRQRTDLRRIVGKVADGWERQPGHR
jgi:hypothetical protein